METASASPNLAKTAQVVRRIAGHAPWFVGTAFVTKQREKVASRAPTIAAPVQPSAEMESVTTRPEKPAIPVRGIVVHASQVAEMECATPI